MVNQTLLKDELPSLNQIVVLDISKGQWKSMCIKAINSFLTKVFVKDIKSKKTLQYLKQTVFGLEQHIWYGEILMPHVR